MKIDSKQVLNSIIFFLIVFAAPLSAATFKLQEKIGSQDLVVLQNPKFVTILAIKALDEKNTPSLKEVHLSRDQMLRLKTNLLEDHNYDFERAKKCRLDPEISFKFHGDKEEIVDLFVSPKCRQILLRTDKHSVILNYEPAHERLDYFFKQLINEAEKR